MAPRDDRKSTRRIDAKDYEEILRTCTRETARGTRMFGLFGRPEAGKTSFIYSVGKLIQGGRSHGSLGRFGLLWASQGIGRFVPAINNSAQESYGFALGYQIFLDDVFRAR